MRRMAENIARRSACSSGGALSRDTEKILDSLLSVQLSGAAVAVVGHDIALSLFSQHI
jgi:hypothetical protein